MEISDRIKKLGKYFNTMQVVAGDNGRQLMYVVVNFPEDWPINEEGAKKRNVTAMEGDYPGQCVFCADIDTGSDAIFDAIDENIEKMKEAIERARLLKEKTQLLRSIFEDGDNSIDKLRSLEFKFGLEDDNDKEEVIITKQKDKEKK